MTTTDPSNKLRRFLGAALGVLVLTIGLVSTAAPASAEVLPVDDSGCPAGGDPSSALPCVKFHISCPKFGLDLLLANGANAAQTADFVVTTGTGTTTYDVAPGDTSFPNVHIGEDQTISLSVTETASGRAFLTNESFTRDCTDPGATVGTMSCADGALVSVSNDGGETGTSPVDFRIDVYDNGANAPTRTVSIDDVVGDASTTIPPAAGDGQVRIVVTAISPEGAGFPATEEVVADSTQAVDCHEPTVTLSHACATGLDVTVTAPAGQDETAFHVTLTTSGGTVVIDQDVTVPAGGSTTVNLPNPVEGETYTAAVIEDGTEGPVLATETITVDCQEPTATVVIACAEGGDVEATVTTGAGQDETHFDITWTSEIGVATLADQVIAAGSTATFGFASPGEGETISVTVTETGGQVVLASDDLVVDCLDPAVTITHECADGDVLVHITAPANQDETDFAVTITNQGGAVVLEQDISLPAGGSVDVELVDPPDGPYTVLVTEAVAAAAEGATVSEVVIPVDCDHPAPTATADHECATGITVELVTTDAQVPSTDFSVVITDEDGTVVLDRDVTIQGAGTSTVVFADPAEDETSHVLVTAGTTTLVNADLAVDCTEVLPTEVQGTQTRRGLPQTGAPGTEHLLALALGLIMAGVGVAGLAGDKRLAWAVKR